VTTTKSPALIAMQALHQALITDKKPKGAWSRVPHRGPANDALTDLLRALVILGAHFDVDDIALIDRTCGAYSTTGTFNTDIHSAALSVGNASAADSWERAHGWPGPWTWSGEQIASIVTRDGHGRVKGYERGTPPLKRLGATSAILLNGEWWRVYQIGADELRLSQTPGDNGLVLPETRKGIRRVTHTRETWAVVVKAERAKAKDAAKETT